eukprot:gene4381-5126_t
MPALHHNSNRNSLTEHEQGQIRFVHGSSCDIAAITVARLYEGRQGRWDFTGIVGAVSIITNRLQKVNYIRINDLQSTRTSFEQEIYEGFGYTRQRDFFHTFEGDNAVYGLSFVDVGEAAVFHASLLNARDNLRRGSQNQQQQQQQYYQQQPSPVRDHPTKPKKSKSGFFSKILHGSSAEEKPMEISGPTGFKHESHIGWDPEKGFDIDNIPNEWRVLFAQAGIKRKDLKDAETSKFIVSVIGETMAAQQMSGKSAPPPPPPTSSGHQQVLTPIRSNAPPPPPPTNTQNKGLVNQAAPQQSREHPVEQEDTFQETYTFEVDTSIQSPKPTPPIPGATRPAPPPAVVHHQGPPVAPRSPATYQVVTPVQTPPPMALQTPTSVTPSPRYQSPVAQSPVQQAYSAPPPPPPPIVSRSAPPAPPAPTQMPPPPPPPAVSAVPVAIPVSRGAPAAAPLDNRSDLMASIRSGKALKNVDTSHPLPDLNEMSHEGSKSLVDTLSQAMALRRGKLGEDEADGDSDDDDWDL